jgi:tetratricopeptide (TPR) repeat protein
MSIGDKDVITWNSFPDKRPGRNTVGFLAQVSPDGRYAVVTLNEEVYVENFTDYRFLQVFYPTRGILAWHDRATGRIKALPGADDPDYVQTDGVWSPDGKYIVFARARAGNAYPGGARKAEYANDRNETQVQYDLYRIPFNEGRGGRPKLIEGASRNGMSNTFPKVSPDGRWIVFVQCRNGQLMRPDSQLYIVPAEGGRARRMQCNTPLMNSWHSFSPNGRWLVFSSKGRSPYTQMYVTHLDEQGRDSPAILIENTTAANRAVNIPEFANIAPDGLLRIDVPASEFYRLYDEALELTKEGREAAAIEVWRRALEIGPDNAEAQNNAGVLLVRSGKFAEATARFQKAAELKPRFADAQYNLGGALYQTGRLDEAIGRWRRAVEINPDFAEAYFSLGLAFVRKGGFDQAIACFERALEINPDYVEVRYHLGRTLYSHGRTADALAHWHRGLRAAPDNLPLLTQTAWVLATFPDAEMRNGPEAVQLAERAVRLSGGREPGSLGLLGAAYAEAGRFSDALKAARQALALATEQNQQSLVEALTGRIALYQAGTPFREERRPQQPQ